MNGAALLGLVLVALAMALALRRARRHGRRTSLLSAPDDPTWDGTLKRLVPLWKRLPEDVRAGARAGARVLLAEKTWEGCGGLELTDEQRLVIAAQAALLQLRPDATWYPDLVSVVVYPTSYRVHTAETDEAGVVTEEDEEWAGESWDAGTVVLAWDDVLRRGGDYEPGFNVVLHEFAHQLDGENGADDGRPLLVDDDLARRWPIVMAAAFDALQRTTNRGCRDVLDEYGADEPAEFFAVATETFFEQGRRLRASHPALYDLLRDYYRLDPASWTKL